MTRSSRAICSQRVSLGMCVRKCAVAVAASMTISSFALAINPNAKPTAGVYDEQTVNSNTADFDATGNSFSEARFAARIRDAYLNNFGGVIDGTYLTELYGFGAGNSKSYDLLWNSNSSVTPPSTVTAISGATAYVTGAKDVTMNIGGILEGGAVGEKTVEIGLTALSQTNINFGAVTVKALLDNGQSVSATRNISEAGGQGDTFFGLRAPPGHYITDVNITHNRPSGTALYFDDVAFRTAVVAP